MSDDHGGDIITISIAMLLFMGIGVGVSVYDDIKYPIGAYVSTTDEYNSTFNDSFSGHIIAKSRERITVRNENGEEKTLCEKWIKVGGV